MDVGTESNEFTKSNYKLIKDDQLAKINSDLEKERLTK